MSGNPTGYLHRAYAASFEDMATPRELPECGAWILERRIEGTDLRDAMGCYPLFCCRDWARLPQELARPADDLVSLTLVTDPFGRFRVEDLQRAFDVVRLYKSHYVTDLTRPQVARTRRHRRNTARAQEAVSLVRVTDPATVAGRWVELYETLVAGHGLIGLHAFSRRCLERQLEVPGLRLFAAMSAERIVGLHLWYVQGEVAYAHLGATDTAGYHLMASYALYAFAIEQLRPEVRWLALGGAPDLSVKPQNGLSEFKRGWATGTRPVYLCGKILRPDEYRRLAADAPPDETYFPAYRRNQGVASASPRTDASSGLER